MVVQRIPGASSDRGAGELRYAAQRWLLRVRWACLSGDLVESSYCVE